MSETIEAYNTVSGGIIVSLVEEDAPLCQIAAGDVRYLPQIVAVLSPHISPQSSPTPSSRPVAGEAVQDAIRNFRLVVQAGPSDAQIVQDCAAILSALDALREAVTPVQDYVAASDQWDERYESPFQRQFYTLKRDRVHALLNALSALLGGDDA